MDTQTIKEAGVAALKELKTKSPTYWAFSLDYCTSLVVPFKAGIQILEAMEDAQIIIEGYSKPPEVSPMSKEHSLFKPCVLSHEDLAKYKTAQLLGVKLDELKAST